MTVVQILNAIAPQYIDAENKDVLITLAKQRTSREYFKLNYTLAVALRTAHLLELSSNAKNGYSGGGVITSKSEGDLSVSFGTVGNHYNKYPDLAGTSYGRQLIDLIMGNGIPVTVSN
jgi:hypothetical protein